MTDVPDMIAKLDRVEAFVVSQHEKMEAFVKATNDLASRAKALVDALDDEEKNHGGLVRTESLRAKNELRLELSKWAK